MIKYLKKLWKRCFGFMGNSRIKKEVIAVKNTSTSIPVLIVKPQHCEVHNRFKKSCPNCQEVIK
tara:strand:+ start:58 stop:249 length:192 start_codon:yes stop_codon:yes gene_type:complete